jgi:hypothetical protein
VVAAWNIALLIVMAVTSTNLTRMITCTVHYIASPGSKVSRNDCRLWNMSYEYKSICTVQLKFSHKKTQENIVVTNEPTQKYINTVSSCYLHNLSMDKSFLVNKYSSTEQNQCVFKCRFSAILNSVFSFRIRLLR